MPIFFIGFRLKEQNKWETYNFTLNISYAGKERKKEKIDKTHRCHKTKQQSNVIHTIFLYPDIKVLPNSHTYLKLKHD